MSGEITVQRGHTFTEGERIDHAKLNAAGAPTARIDPGAITSTEMDTASVSAAVAAATKGANLFRNPALVPDLWRSTEEAIAVTTGTRIQPAEGWFVKPAGADTTARYSQFVPTDSEVAQSMEISGATGTTTVDAGQFIPSWIAGGLATVTLRAYLYNGTGADFTPTVRIDAAGTIDDESTTSNVLAENLAECPNSQWTLIEKTLTVSGLTLTNGADVVIRFPSGTLNSTGKLVRVARLQLTPAAQSAPWVHPNPPAIYDNLYAASAPTVSDDSTKGYSTSSTWIWGTRVYVCSDPAPGAAVWTELTTPVVEEVIIAHTAAQNTNGGTATSGSWETVQFNTILLDTADLSNPENDEVLTVSSGAIDLPTGLWEIDCEVPRIAVDRFQSRLYDVTGAAVMKYDGTSTDILGTCGYGISTTTSGSGSIVGGGVTRIVGRFRLTSQKTIRVEARVERTRATTGCGVAGNFTTEIYAVCRLKRLSL